MSLNNNVSCNKITSLGTDAITPVFSITDIAGVREPPLKGFPASAVGLITSQSISSRPSPSVYAARCHGNPRNITCNCDFSSLKGPSPTKFMTNEIGSGDSKQAEGSCPSKERLKIEEVQPYSAGPSYVSVLPHRFVTSNVLRNSPKLKPIDNPELHHQRSPHPSGIRKPIGDLGEKQRVEYTGSSQPRSRRPIGIGISNQSREGNPAINITSDTLSCSRVGCHICSCCCHRTNMSNWSVQTTAGNDIHSNRGIHPSHREHYQKYPDHTRVADSHHYHNNFGQQGLRRMNYDCHANVLCHSSQPCVLHRCCQHTAQGGYTATATTATPTHTRLEVPLANESAEAADASKVDNELLQNFDESEYPPIRVKIL